MSTRKSVMLGLSFVITFTLLGQTAALAHVRNPIVDDKAQLTNNGAAAVVSGSVLCDNGEHGSVSVLLSQDKGKKSVFGVGGAEVFCTGQRVSFALPVHAIDEGIFTTGPASARVSVSSSQQCDPMDFSCTPGEHRDDRTVTQTVHLRR